MSSSHAHELGSQYGQVGTPSSLKQYHPLFVKQILNLGNISNILNSN